MGLPERLCEKQNSEMIFEVQYIGKRTSFLWSEMLKRMRTLEQRVNALTRRVLLLEHIDPDTPVMELTKQQLDHFEQRFEQHAVEELDG